MQHRTRGIKQPSATRLARLQESHRSLFELLRDEHLGWRSDIDTKTNCRTCYFLARAKRLLKVASK